jgi:hypothetical protein
MWIPRIWGEIQSPWLGDKVDSGTGLRSTLAYGSLGWRVVVDDSVVDIRWGYSQLRHIGSHTPCFSLDSVFVYLFMSQSAGFLILYLRHPSWTHQWFSHPSIQIAYINSKLNSFNHLNQCVSIHALTIPSLNHLIFLPLSSNCIHIVCSSLINK